MATPKRAALEAAKEHADQLRHDFPGWLDENYDIYAEFEAEAVKISKFRKHYSARTIAEILRHNSMVREKGNGYKLNNVRIPCMARLFAILNPKHAGLFEFRRSEMRVSTSEMARAA